MKMTKILLDVTKRAFDNIMYAIETNMVRFASVVAAALPYIAFWFGKLDRPYLYIMFILIIQLLNFYLKSIANYIGKGITVPIPKERFTEIDDDGEVTIESSRIQELILYMADLEDWIERKGLK